MRTSGPNATWSLSFLVTRDLLTGITRNAPVGASTSMGYVLHLNFQFRIRRQPPPGSPSPPSAPSFSCSSLGVLARRYGCRPSTYILRDRLPYRRGLPKTCPSPAPLLWRPA